MSCGAGGAGILRLIRLELASLAARASGLRGRGGETSGGAGDLCRCVKVLVSLLLCSFAYCRFSPCPFLRGTCTWAHMRYIQVLCRHYTFQLGMVNQQLRQYTYNP